MTVPIQLVSVRQKEVRTEVSVTVLLLMFLHTSVKVLSTAAIVQEVQLIVEGCIVMKIPRRAMNMVSFMSSKALNYERSFLIRGQSTLTVIFMRKAAKMTYEAN